MENLILDQDIHEVAKAARLGIRDNRGRAQAAIVMLWTMTGITGLLLISYLLQFEMWYTAYERSLQMVEIQLNIFRQAILWILYYIGLIISAVFFIRWFRRAYYNLHVLNSEYLNYSEGWAAGCWFVPFINLVYPYRIMREIAEETTEQANKLDSAHNSAPVVNRAGWWWGLWIAAIVVMRISNLTGGSKVIKVLLISSGAVAVSLGLEIICALVAISLIKQVSSIEKELYEHREKLVKQSASRSVYNPVF